jgi:hypothetical protein
LIQYSLDARKQTRPLLRKDQRPNSLSDLGTLYIQMKPREIAGIFEDWLSVAFRAHTPNVVYMKFHPSVSIDRAESCTHRPEPPLDGVLDF